MHFLFNRENHKAELRFSFDDTTSTIGAQLEHFGHTWEINDRQVSFAADTVNVLFEGFSEEALQVYGAHVRQGARYLCIATEQPTGYDAHGMGGEFNFGKPDHMHGRQAKFIEACDRLDFVAIWPLVAGDETLAWYRRWCPRVAHLPIGFAPRMLRSPAREPEFDFGMYGSIPEGARRWRWLERLHQETGASVHILGSKGIVPVEERDAEMQRCRVLLQIRPSEDSELVSSSRIAASLHAGRCVVAEHHRLPGLYGQVARFAPEPGFASFRRSCQLALAHWRGEYLQQMAAFREILSPEATLLPALEAAGIGRGVPRPALVAVTVWGGEVDTWLTRDLPQIQAGVPALRGKAERLIVRVYTSDVDVRRLAGEPGIQALGEICDVELRGMAPDPADAIFADGGARVHELAATEAARSGHSLRRMGA